MVEISLDKFYSEEDWESLCDLKFSSSWGRYIISTAKEGIIYRELEKDVSDRATLIVLSTATSSKINPEYVHKAKYSLMEIVWVLFKDKLEDIPIRLNSENSDVRKAAQWRLARGV